MSAFEVDCEKFSSRLITEQNLVVSQIMCAHVGGPKILGTKHSARWGGSVADILEARHLTCYRIKFRCSTSNNLGDAGVPAPVTGAHVHAHESRGKSLTNVTSRGRGHYSRLRSTQNISTQQSAVMLLAGRALMNVTSQRREWDGQRAIKPKRSYTVMSLNASGFILRLYDFLVHST